MNKEKLEILKDIENPKYCTKEIGKILYSDKLLSIERIEKINDVFRIYSGNTKYNKSIIDELNKYKKEGIFSNVIAINSFLYSKKYLNFLNKLPKNKDNLFYMCKGLTDVGYIELTNNYKISKDLRISPEITIIKKDIINTVIGFQGKPIRKLTYKDSEFINRLDFNNKKNILLLGVDLGYLLFLMKDNKDVENLYIYDRNPDLLKFVNENILKNINTHINVHILKENIDDLEVPKINANLNMIIISSMIEIQEQINYYYRLKLFHFEDILNTNFKEIMFNKYKQDLQDLIMTNKESVIKVLLNTYRDTKGLSSELLGLQLDFIEKADIYLNKDKVFFDNYKKYQKFINRDSVIIDILKT